jgi:hypothetical protein
LSDTASLPPIQRMSSVGDTLLPETAKVSMKRESSRRKQRQPEQEGPEAPESEDPEESGRQLDIEA